MHFLAIVMSTKTYASQSSEVKTVVKSYEKYARSMSNDISKCLLRVACVKGGAHRQICQVAKIFSLLMSDIYRFFLDCRTHW